MRVCAIHGSPFLPNDAETLDLRIHGLAHHLQPEVWRAAPSPNGLPIFPHTANAPTAFPISEGGRAQARGPGIYPLLTPWLWPSWFTSNRPLFPCCPFHAPNTSQSVSNQHPEFKTQTRPNHSSTQRPPGSSSLSVKYKSHNVPPAEPGVASLPAEPHLARLLGGCPLFRVRRGSPPGEPYAQSLEPALTEPSPNKTQGPQRTSQGYPLMPVMCPKPSP